MKKVLVANRGEIAVRIIRACADYGVTSVAVYADADVDSLHVRMADEAYALDGHRPAQTYLDSDKLLAVAARAGADAVHPGYGFLSENAAFAQAVLDAGLIWIGPPPACMAVLGNKMESRSLALRIGAPLMAGTPGPVTDVAEVTEFARKHGLPIVIKAAYGGGGRGLKIVRRMDEVAEAFASAQREAAAAFGNDECFVEQFLDKPRHVEAQVLADTQGNVAVLGTRDCSLQRRNQKLVEEAPAPFLRESQEHAIIKAARDICREAGYVGAGTVEFLLSGLGIISFLEVNTRLQVEHTVTEESLGVDLVLEQLRIADGQPLGDLVLHAPPRHAIEFRINAEDPGRGFIPTPGKVTRFDPPSGIGVRLDTGVVAGSVVPGTFDSLMAKLVVSGATRQEALARARRALKEFCVEGVASTLPFFRAVLEHEDFISDAEFNVHTKWIETEFSGLPDADARPLPLPEEYMRRTVVEWDGRLHRLGLPEGLGLGWGQMTGAPAGGLAGTGAGTGVGASGPGVAEGPSCGAEAVLAPVSGTVHIWKVEDGATVAQGDLIAVMEAMKMEVQVTAHQPGVITFAVAVGEYQMEGDVIAAIR